MQWRLGLGRVAGSIRELRSWNYVLFHSKTAPRRYPFVQAKGCSRRSVATFAVLDLNLPKNEGIPVPRAARQSERLANVSVVIINSSRSLLLHAKREQLHVTRTHPRTPDLVPLRRGAQRYIDKAPILENSFDSGGRRPISDILASKSP